MQNTQPTPTQQPAQAPVDPSQFGEYSNWAKGELAKGFTADQLHQSLQQNGASVAPAQAPHESGNWFTHLLPTVGGIAGGALGSLADVFSGPLGTIGGSALGSAGGKALEDALEGKQVGSDVLGAAAEGGIGAGVGGVVGKGLGALGGLAKGAAEKVTQGAADATAQAAKVARAQATHNNFGITDRLQGGDHLALGTNQDLIEKLGYNPTDPYAMAKAGEAGYHPTDLSLNTIYDQTLQNAAPVDMSHFGNDLYKTMQNNGTVDLGTSPLNKALQDFHTKTEGAYNKDNTLNMPNNMNATDVRKLQQSVGNEMGNQQTLINNAGRSGITNTQAEADHAMLSKLYGELGDKIKTPEVDAAIASRKTTPEELNALKAKFGDVHGQHIADTIDNASSAQDLLTPMQSYTQMSQAGRMGIDNIENKTGTTMAASRAKSDLNGDGTADVNPINPVDLAHDFASAKGAGGKSFVLAKHTLTNPGVLNTLSRIGAMSDKLKIGGKELPGVATIAGTTLGTSPNLGADPVAQSANGTIGGTMQNQSTTGAPGTTDPNDLSGILAHYVQMVNQAPQLAGTLGPVIQNLAPLVQKQKLAASTANGLEGAYANAGGAQGTGGILSQISSLIPGTAANTYENQKKTAAAQLAASLGISPEQAAGILPQLMQNQQSAGVSQGVLSGLTGQLQ